MKKLHSVVIAVGLLGLYMGDVYASHLGINSPPSSWPQWAVDLWNSFHPSSGGGGHSVPELSASYFPLAIAVLAGIVGIGYEKQRRHDKKV